MNHVIEQNMNKNPFFTGSIQSVEDATTRIYEGAAFGAIHFDGMGQAAAISAALDQLEAAQSQCCEADMQTGEVGDACAYLTSQNGKVAPLVARFWKALAIPDQVVRFEVTAQTLRVIRQQFG